MQDVRRVPRGGVGGDIAVLDPAGHRFLPHRDGDAEHRLLIRLSQIGDRNLARPRENRKVGSAKVKTVPRREFRRRPASGRGEVGRLISRQVLIERDHPERIPRIPDPGGEGLFLVHLDMGARPPEIRPEGGPAGRTGLAQAGQVLEEPRFRVLHLRQVDGREFILRLFAGGKRHQRRRHPKQTPTHTLHPPPRRCWNCRRKDGPDRPGNRLRRRRSGKPLPNPADRPDTAVFHIVSS